MTGTATNAARARILCLVVTCILTATAGQAQDARQAEDASEIDVPALLRDVARVSIENRKMHARRYSAYGFMHRRVHRQKNRKGEIKENVVVEEVANPDLRAIGKMVRSYVTVEKNGKPVSGEKVTKERVKMGERLDKVERGAQPSQEKLRELDERIERTWATMPFVTNRKDVGRDVWIETAEFFAGCEFYAPRRERVGDREMIALAFRSRPGATFPERMWFMPRAEGMIWIDAADKVLVGFALWGAGAKTEGLSHDRLMGTAALAYDLIRMEEGSTLR